jgi:ribokinase
MADVPTLLCIGKSTQDVFLKAASAFMPYEDKGVVYERLPLGSKLDLDDVIMSTGGNVTNAAVTFARQGLHAKYAWVLGTDMVSEGILRELDDEGVDTGPVVQKDGYFASYSTILLATTGERTILNYKGTAVTEAGFLNLDALNGSDWVYISSLGNMELLEDIINKAHVAGAKVFLNPAGAELAQADKLRALLPDVEVLAVNREEAAQIVEGGSSEELARSLSRLCPVIIVSDGPNGVVATDGSTIVSAGMYEDVPVVDRTGAGDAFGSGFLSQIAQGKTLEEAIVFASANSTSVVSYIGAKAGILHTGAALHDMPLESKPF